MNVKKLLWILIGALAVASYGCGSDECESSEDCEEIDCGDGVKVRACVDGECQTEC